MKKLLMASLLISSTLSNTALADAPNEKAITFEAGDKTTKAYQGSFFVPENRNNPNSRQIEIKYVRFPATGDTKGSPIVYLAGGPGGSGVSTAKYRRYDMFMALREYGDVIAYEQRGTGLSNNLPNCTSDITIPDDTYTSDTDYASSHRQALSQCLHFWKESGIDIEGYDTVQNALDIDDLRKHLGADKVTLWGISYGSHLALAALKEIENSIDKVIIASAEGLGETVKRPARTDDYFDRLQAAIDTQSAAKAAYPDIKAMMKRVHSKLDANPIMLDVPQKDGSTAKVLLHRRDMQQMASGLISDPNRAAQMLSLYLAVDNDIIAPVAQLAARWFEPGTPIRMRTMSTLTDIASGMTAQHKADIKEQAKTSLLKDYLNFSYQYDGVAPELDLGDTFRTKPTSEIPLLLLSGTLDGRTYIESQIEAVSEMPNVTTITVKNAGHNLFMTTPKVQEAMNRFMEGKSLENNTITIELPDFAPKR